MSSEGWEQRLAELRAEVEDLRRAVEEAPKRTAPPAQQPARPLVSLSPGSDSLGYGQYDDVDDLPDDDDEPTADSKTGEAPVPGMWADIALAPPDSIFGVVQTFKADPHPKKCDLVVGAYRTNEGKPYLLPSVAIAEERLASQRINKLYGRIDGLEAFTRASAELVLGTQSPALREGRVALCQSLSGTGALATCANFYSQYVPIKTAVYLSRPTWANHKQIFDFFGFHNIVEYRYWDPVSRGLDFDGMIDDLRTAPARSIVVLHLCAHNPTGCDPTPQQWRTIGQILHERRMHVVFDSAYQGYATGDLDRDAAPARIFEQIGVEFAITQSYSKNMGLYGERIGCFSYVCSNKGAAQRIQSQTRAIVRESYSNPPIYGARIVHMLLTDPELRAKWGQELMGMSQRIIEMRALLRRKLEELKTPGTWNHITDQIGMFSYTGLTAEQVKYITAQYHVYLLSSGRVSMAGLNTGNIDYIAKAIDDAVRRLPAQITAANGNGNDEPASFNAPFRLPSPLGLWSQLPWAPEDMIFETHGKYLADDNPRKLNLVMVAKGVPKLRPVVAEAEIKLAEKRMQKEYAPIDGDRGFSVAAAKLILGVSSPALKDNRVALCQSVGGTGALSIVASFYSRFLPIHTSVLFSNPTWYPHERIFQNRGFRNQRKYRYWDPKTRSLDFKGMCEDIEAAPRRSIVVLQLCAHNPTGVDPTREQWKQIGQICKNRRHHIVLDNAFQGWATGDVEEDAWPARYFERALGLEFCITQSYSKPMGLYNERIGCFIYVCKQEQSALKIASQAKVIARRLYSNPPLHGARIVEMILNDQGLRRKWKDEVRESFKAIQEKRQRLSLEVQRLGTGGRHFQWDNLSKQSGMFLYSGLTPTQVNFMRVKYHIYMPANGRMSLTGLQTTESVLYAAAAIHDAVQTHPFPAAVRGKL